MVKNPPDNAGDARDAGLIPGWGRFRGEKNDYPLQYSYLEELDGQKSLVSYRPYSHKELDAID